MSSSAFMQWFTLQFGIRSRSSETDDRLRDIVAAGEGAAAKLRRRAEWDSKQASALYAWQITDRDREKWLARARGETT